MKITFGNVEVYSKNLDEFINTSHYKAAGGGDYNHSRKDYLEILNNSIPEKIQHLPFKDKPLYAEEIQKIQLQLVKKIQPLLQNREILTQGSNLKGLENS